MSLWDGLSEELALWRDAGRDVDLWWRDDDAGATTPALERMLSLASASDVPLALAVIPAKAEREMVEALPERITVIQHGTDHVNRAGAGEKKTEFPALEPAAEALSRLAAARARLREMAGARFLPVLAPPWNRLPEQLLPHLRPAYVGLSRYGPRKGAAALLQINTHVDIVAWQGDRRFVGEEAALRMTANHLAMRRQGEVDAAEPTGLLTHHASHDETAWRFLERLFAFTCEAGARWRAAAEIFR